MSDRYQVESSDKVIVVVDTKHSRYKPGVGLMAYEEPWILAYWFETVFEHIQEELLHKANMLCELLNDGYSAITELNIKRTNDEQIYYPRANECATGDPMDDGRLVEENKTTLEMSDE